MKILWLASWYPNRTSPYNGDFIQRHAEAVSQKVDKLTVLAVVKDNSMAAGTTETIRHQQGNLESAMIYYGPSKWLPEKVGSLLMSFRLQCQYYRKWVAENGAPSFLHVHVPLKAGLLALYCSYFKGIPYLVSEHWAGYDAASRPGIGEMGGMYRLLNAWIFKRAKMVLAVSQQLAEALQHRYRPRHVALIPNVVDTRIFYPRIIQQTETLRIIHVSGMNYQKNLEGILQALVIWQQQGGRFVLECYGRIPDNAAALVGKLELNERVFFRGEASQPAIAEAMRNSDVLILYSRYETFGCVLIEANACGIPVIVSDLPVFHEIVTEGENGLFAKGEDPSSLAAQLEFFYSKRERWQPEQIAAKAAARFGYEQVGRSIREIYQRLVGG